MRKWIVGLALLCAAAALESSIEPSQDDAGDRLVLVTFDGARYQEVFGGLDPEILRSTLADGQKLEESPTYRRFWADTSEDRRRKLMPFFWSLLTDHGSIAGNPALGSSVRLSNRHRFSYPGYAEILLGEAHDDVIASNDPVRNPYRTVLEILRERFARPSDVATFASWGVFDAIVEHNPGATFVNAGLRPLVTTGSTGHAPAAGLSSLQYEVTTPWANTRFDAFTFRLAMQYIEVARPRVLYIAFDETDDWAHDGRYDLTLNAYARTDAYLKELWTWLQSQAEYRDRTHLLITTDHGRGRTASDWRHHGAKIEGAEDVWIGFASPRMSRRGEWRDHAPLSTNQVAATVAGWMGVDWNRERPAAGRPIASGPFR